MENLSLGVDIAVTGMLVVFVALALISVAIALLPRVLVALEPMIGPERERHVAASPAPMSSVPSAEDDEALLVAIGYVLAHHHRLDGERR